VQFAATVPTVLDRVAQMVVKSRLEPEIEPLFHPSSFGYRPGKSALDAVGSGQTALLAVGRGAGPISAKIRKLP
jgi:hypothetical protein